jgi:hypothetical protein
MTEKGWDGSALSVQKALPADCQGWQRGSILKARYATKAACSGPWWNGFALLVFLRDLFAYKQLQAKE